MLMSWIDFLMISLTAVIGAAMLVVPLTNLERKGRINKPLGETANDGPVFLFDRTTLQDATPEAMAMISPYLDHMNALDATIQILGPHFPKLQDTLGEETQGSTRIDDDGIDNLWIDIERNGDRLRISVNGHSQSRTDDVTDIIERDIRMSELQLLRDFTHNTPQLIWQEDPTGKLLWANHAYLAFCDKLQSDQTTGQQIWPSKPLLPELHETSIGKVPSLRRLAVTLPDKKSEQWFDVTSVRRNDSLIHFATDANAVVRADQERRNFVQTLTKTFAQLSIGLAIFDKRRQLAMFNPALLDMTNLPIEFLSGRPTVDGVLDRLRESRMLPEPKDYTTWRDQFSALEQAAKDGNYSETWNLPDGQTYRVTGRPHPDGAIAFLFEDISAEISLTRRFRSDIETGQAVLDTLPEAIAVFSSSGTLMMSNKAYGELWGPICDQSVQQHELQHAAQVWQERCAPTPMWSELRGFVQMLGPRKPWTDSTIMDDGRQINCTANPIMGGMTMIKFGLGPQQNPILQKLSECDNVLVAAKG